MENTWIICSECAGAGKIEERVDVDFCRAYTCEGCNGKGEIWVGDGPEPEYAPAGSIDLNAGFIPTGAYQFGPRPTDDTCPF